MDTVVGAKSSRKYAGLEIVRAIAALTVVYNHIFTFNLIPKSVLLALPGQYATEAVIIFFVLSGVVITLSAERKEAIIESRRRMLRVYLRARLVRIYPIYLLGLAMAFAALRLIDGVWPDAKQAFGALFFLQSQGYIIATPKYDAPLWTLAMRSPTTSCSASACYGDASSIFG